VYGDAEEKSRMARSIAQPISYQLRWTRACVEIGQQKERAAFRGVVESGRLLFQIPCPLEPLHRTDGVIKWPVSKDASQNPFAQLIFNR
jgi:hypothetical protein